MFEENYYEEISDFIKKSDFGEKRNYGYETHHAGDDYVSRKFKKQKIYNLISGIVVKKGKSIFAGNYVILKHNFKFIGGVDEIFYSEYKHLDSISPFMKKNRFIDHGIELGNMGNTGYCKTYDDKKWRLLTEEEKKDPDCIRGVHIHFEFYQNENQIPNNSMLKVTSLMSELMNLNLIEPDDYFFRKGKIYINPKIIMAYAKILLEVRNLKILLNLLKLE